MQEEIARRTEELAGFVYYYDHQDSLFMVMSWTLLRYLVVGELVMGTSNASGNLAGKIGRIVGFDLSVDGKKDIVRVSFDGEPPVPMSFVEIVALAVPEPLAKDLQSQCSCLHSRPTPSAYKFH